LNQADLIRYALKGLDVEIREAQTLRTELHEALTDLNNLALREKSAPLAVVKNTRRPMSAAARRRISQAMKRRYRNLRK
jgi:hypothetical protein